MSWLRPSHLAGGVSPALLVEGGGKVAAAFLKAELVDRLSVLRGGRLLGADSRSAVAALGLEKLDFAPRFTLVSSRVLGGDVLESWTQRP